MEKVSLDTIKPWITQRINELLGFEDDVVIEFVFNMLESNRVRILYLKTKMLNVKKGIGIFANKGRRKIHVSLLFSKFSIPLNYYATIRSLICTDT